jgi:hypothetical protein
MKSLSRGPIAFLALLSVLLAAPASAVVYLVPDDAVLAQRSSLIVIGTVESTEPRIEPSTIITATRLRVEEMIGGGPPAASLEVVEEGGAIGSRAVMVSGLPRYWPGERVLLFLSKDPGGRWRTESMSLGKFNFVTDPDGQELLLRGLGEEEIFGFDTRGNRHDERPRLAREFIRFLRAVARGERPVPDYFASATRGPWEPEVVEEAAGELGETSPEPASATSIVTNSHVSPSAYLSGQIRWDVFDKGGSVGFRVSGSQPGYDSTGAAQRALAAWTNDPSSNINYQYVGTTTAGFVEDGVNAIVYNASTGVPSGAIAYARWYGGGQHTYKGETFYSTIEGDVIVRSGLTISQKAFDEAVTHELGHTLGFRHSNEGTPSSTNAVMYYVVSGNWGASLAPWDQEAAAHVYGSGTVTPPPTCTPAAITSGPFPTTISAGQQTTLSVATTGTTPLSYQWYIGASGNTSTPIAGATGPSVTVSPTSTTSYWVRVSNACGTSNSATATVTVTSPPAPSASSLYLLTPCRIIDTRQATGPRGGPALAARQSRVVTVGGVCGIPADAKAISVNVTVLPPMSTGFLTLYPADSALPLASTINFAGGKIRANNAIVRVSSQGTIAVYNGGSQETHFIIDVSGFFR